MRGFAQVGAALFLAAAVWGAHAQDAPTPPTASSERLADPALEAEARRIGRGLRCVVCQSQSIEDSDAPLAADMRRTVRARLASGASAVDVEDYLRLRYGDAILLRPPVQANTAVLWFGPLLLVLLAGLWWWRASRGGSHGEVAKPFGSGAE